MALASPRIVGRYAIYGELAKGGMATVHLGRLLGPVRFSRTVAIKRLLPQFASDPDFVGMFLDEARLAARIRHTNVVPTIDVVAVDDEILLVMEYVHGESLAWLPKGRLTQLEQMPPRIGAAILRDVLLGLHAAHDAKDEHGAPLGIVHRDVSPQNIIVGADGVARVFDFGIAKAAGRAQVTREGQIKGKLAYMAPEQLSALPVTRETDVFAASIVLWETLTGTRLFAGDSEASVVTKVLFSTIRPPSEIVPDLGDRFDAVVLKGLERDPAKRFASAREMAQALAKVEDLADAAEVAEWLERVAHLSLLERARRVAEVESASSTYTETPQAIQPVLREEAASVETVVARGFVTTKPEFIAAPDGPAPSRRRGSFMGRVAIALAVVGMASTVVVLGNRSPPPLALAEARVSGVSLPPSSRSSASSLPHASEPAPEPLAKESDPGAVTDPAMATGAAASGAIAVPAAIPASSGTRAVLEPHAVAPTTAWARPRKGPPAAPLSPPPASHRTPPNTLPTTTPNRIPDRL